MISKSLKWLQPRKLLFIAAIFLFSFFGETTQLSAQVSHAHLSGKVIFPVRQYSGSPYFVEDWSRGKVVLTNGRTTEEVLLRYDGFSDLLIWLLPDEGNQQVAIDKYLVSNFLLIRADTCHHFLRIDVSGFTGFNDNQAFFQVLQQGPVSLYAYRGVRLSSRLGPVADEQGRIRQALTLISDPKYFLELPDGTLKRVRLNRRSFWQAIGPDLQNSLEALPGRAPRIRTEPDLAQAVLILNSLLK